MPTMETVCSGNLQREDGLDVATGVTLSMNAGEDPHGLGDIRAVIAVHDNPEFARRYVGKRFVFVSAFDPAYKVEVFILGADGACIAFPVPKPAAP
jgi:hypothetical protein